jgi:hypothetical protein
VGVAQDVHYERADVGVLPKRDFGLTILCASRSPTSRCGRGAGSPRLCHLTKPRTGCGLTQGEDHRKCSRPIWS